MQVDELRDDARAWLAAHKAQAPRDYGAILPPDLAEEGRAWQRTLFAAGWAGLHWPVEHGGRGLTIEHTAAWTTECAIAEVPAVDQHGRDRPHRRLASSPSARRSSSGPTCAGSSRPSRSGASSSREPGAGSDLAGLSTRAELDGDDWVVTGQKVWCSNGRVADRGILLARTDPDAPRHAGISFFLVDMAAPGIEVRPLRQMTGGSEFDEVFLDEVRLPRDALLGPLHGGWNVAMATLTNERGYIGVRRHLPRSTARRHRGARRRRRRRRRASGWPSSWSGVARCRRWAAGRVRSRRWRPASPSSGSPSSCSTPPILRGRPGRRRLDARRRRIGPGPGRARWSDRRRHHPGAEEHHRRAPAGPARRSPARSSPCQPRARSARRRITRSAVGWSRPRP